MRVGGAGLCHSDLHLINGDWEQTLPLGLPKTPGHEIAGWVEEVGSSYPMIFSKREIWWQSSEVGVVVYVSTARKAMRKCV